MADADFEQQLVRWCYHLHRFPETGLNEVRTSDYVAIVLPKSEMAWSVFSAPEHEVWRSALRAARGVVSK